MKKKIILLVVGLVVIIPFILTKVFSEKFLSFWSGYLGAVATLAVVWIDRSHQQKNEKDKKIQVISLILQEIYLEYEEILEKYKILLKEYQFSKDITINKRKVDLKYTKMLLIETEPVFASVMNLYILCIEKELSNIENLRNERKNPETQFTSFDVEKRLIPVQNLINEMKNYDNNDKTLKTVESYTEYYKFLLDKYRDEADRA